ncbi:DNA polymerase-3 subunit delta' [Desulfonatronum thiosulfatophilum]|uniref:DNA polymerase-3 subunit delta n=1 Tax=Desulfonatronum thiosulfatophilum TaxID=617002 RepID=A0A1G6A1X5_9BACT|nr:hypothetical protein [Desulfonatronum thiosulfatophilum]SDB02350.1 DNA polymerase-3 subunit delta' [Desulfonatronum thiosulfatophilum]
MNNPSQESETGKAIDPFSLRGQDRVLDCLSRLIERPPRVLLLEGGAAEDREKLGLYWVALLNCMALLNRESGREPCRSCPACTQIRDAAFLDLIYLDGREGRISIDAVRELRGLLGQAPRSGKRRVLVLGEAQELTVEAANALLKSMEETDSRNSFVLLTPQRERLLPTLVSRSWVVTLPWDLEAAGSAAVAPEWEEALCVFLKSGRGWFGKTMAKGQVDRALAFNMIHATRRSLIKACQGVSDSELSRVFQAQGHPRIWRRIDLRLDEAEEALRDQVSPALVLDWLATGMRQSLSTRQI